MWYSPETNRGYGPVLSVAFYRTTSGIEPVRDWLRELSSQDRLSIGSDLKTVQYGWPLGMPVVRKLGGGLWEVRSHVRDGIARVIFTLKGHQMVLLHGFMKKSRKTPAADLAIARRRQAHMEKE